MGMTVSVQVNYLVMDFVGLFPVVGIYTVWRETLAPQKFGEFDN